MHIYNIFFKSGLSSGQRAIALHNHNSQSTGSISPGQVLVCSSTPLLQRSTHRNTPHVAAGAGVALVGLTCCACGAKVRLTDGENRLVKALEDARSH